MARYLTIRTCHTGCRHRSRTLAPEGVVIDLPENSPRAKTWLSKRWIKKVADDTPLTPPKDYKAKMAQAMFGVPGTKKSKRK